MLKNPMPVRPIGPLINRYSSDDCSLDKLKSLLAKNTAVRYLDSALCTAVEKGAIATIGFLLGQQYSVSPHRLLMYAIDHAKPEILKLLLEKKEISDTINNCDSEREGDTALHRATRNEKAEMVRILLEHGADFLIPNKAGDIPLHNAITYWNEDVVRFLVEADKDKRSIHMANNQGNTPFWTMLYKDTRNDDWCIRFIQKEGSITIQEEGNDSLVHIAALRGKVTFLQALIAAGAQLDIQDEEGHTPLHLAAQGGYVEVIRVIAAAGAQLDIQDEEGRTPLHLAAPKGYLETVKALTAAGAQLDIQDEKGHTPLHLAVQQGYEEVVKVLTAAGAQLNIQDEKGCTPLHLAYYFAAAEAVIDAGADLDIQDEEGHTRLHLAAERRELKLVQALVSVKAKLDLLDSRGRTPLHHAAQNGFELAEVLIHAGANLDIQDGEGYTPLHLAVQKRDLRLVQALVGARAKLDLLDGRGRTPLHHAAQNGLELAKALIHAGADLNVQDSEGRTPLHYAVQAKNLLLVKALVDAGCDQGIRDLNNKTPFEQGVEGNMAREYIANPQKITTRLFAYFIKKNNAEIVKVQELLKELTYPPVLDDIHVRLPFSLYRTPVAAVVRKKTFDFSGVTLSDSSIIYAEHPQKLVQCIFDDERMRDESVILIPEQEYYPQKMLRDRYPVLYKKGVCNGLSTAYVIHHTRTKGKENFISHIKEKVDPVHINALQRYTQAYSLPAEVQVSFPASYKEVINLQTILPQQLRSSSLVGVRFCGTNGWKEEPSSHATVLGMPILGAASPYYIYEPNNGNISSPSEVRVKRVLGGLIGSYQPRSVMVYDKGKILEEVGLMEEGNDGIHHMLEAVQTNDVARLRKCINFKFLSHPIGVVLLYDMVRNASPMILRTLFTLSREAGISPECKKQLYFYYGIGIVLQPKHFSDNKVLLGECLTEIPDLIKCVYSITPASQDSEKGEAVKFSRSSISLLKESIASHNHEATTLLLNQGAVFDQGGQLPTALGPLITSSKSKTPENIAFYTKIIAEHTDKLTAKDKVACLMYYAQTGQETLFKALLKKEPALNVSMLIKVDTLHAKSSSFTLTSMITAKPERAPFALLLLPYISRLAPQHQESLCCYLMNNGHTTPVVAAVGRITDPLIRGRILEQARLVTTPSPQSFVERVMSPPSSPQIG